MNKICNKCKTEKSLDCFYKHKHQKDGLRAQCKACHKERARFYRKQNSEKVAEYSKTYRQKNKKCYKCRVEKSYLEFYKNRTNKDGLHNLCKACDKECGRIYREQNKEYLTEYNKAYREENKEYLAEYNKNYYEENKEALSEYHKQYHQNNREVRRKHSRKSNRKRRARKKAVQENFTAQDELNTRNLFGHKCFNCESKDNLAIDHHRPLSKGFALEPMNAVLLCKSCNSSKKNKMPEEFYNEEQLELLDFMLTIVP